MYQCLDSRTSHISSGLQKVATEPDPGHAEVGSESDGLGQCDAERLTTGLTALSLGTFGIAAGVEFARSATELLDGVLSYSWAIRIASGRWAQLGCYPRQAYQVLRARLSMVIDQRVVRWHQLCRVWLCGEEQPYRSGPETKEQDGLGSNR